MTQTRKITGGKFNKTHLERKWINLRVKTFTEKPKLALAQKFLESGDFVWNAGIFVWNVQAIRKAFQLYLKEIHEIFEEVESDFYKENEEKAIKRAYSMCKNISIDYGVMEKAENVYVILSDFDWSDLGTWKSLYEISDKNEEKNSISGKVITYDTHHCIIKTNPDKLTVIQGLDNFIVIEHENVLLICNKEQEQKVKDFVSDAKNLGNEFV